MTQGLARRPRVVVGVLLAVVVAVSAGMVVRHRLGPKHLLTVTPGVLYRSGQLTPEQLEDVVTRYGIRTVVNLRSENERSRGDWYALEADRLEALDVALVDLPMNTGFPPRDEVLGAWLALIGTPDRQPMLVHCEYGVIRTGIMVAIYEVERLGLSTAEALGRFEWFGRDAPEAIESRIDAYFADYVPRRDAG
jgi:protein tyrosine/serine phosphatase